MAAVNEAIPESERQPTRTGRAEKTRTFDQTFLDTDTDVIHRDLLAHSFRWQHTRGPDNFADQIWASGLVDGEGCFSLRVADRSDKGTQVQWTFTIGLRADDEDTLLKLQQILGVGSISSSQNKRVTNAKPLAILSVSAREDIAELVEFFRAFPLQSKKARDFYWWAEAFDLFAEHYTTERNHNNIISPEHLEKFRQYDAWIKEQRKYQEPKTHRPDERYIAHALRWGFSKRNFIEHEKTSVLDVGCGPNRPLLLVLFGGIGASPLAKRYVGVDLNKIKPTNHKRSTLYPEFNFIERVEELRKKEGTFDLITNFEVIEHMPMEKGRELLYAMKRMLAPGGRILLSTPVYDRKARAANHIHEYTIGELTAMIDLTGLEVEDRYGTFANYNDIKKVAEPEHLKTLNDIRGWFGNEVAACFLAPLYPDQSRNNYWIIKASK